jgi:uncharacterized protein GlcG (DUF336 family)
MVVAEFPLFPRFMSIVGILWLLAAPARVPAQDHLLPDAPNKTAVAAACESCHGIITVIEHKRSPQQWDDIMREMAQQGMVINDDQRKSIVSYLNAYFGQAKEFVPRPSPIRGVGPGWALALEAAEAAQKACRLPEGRGPTVRVVDSAGTTIVLLTGDGVSPITLLNSAIKAATVLRFKEPSGLVMTRLDGDPVLADEIRNDPSIGMVLQGGVPIMVNGDELIGAIAVSGASGPADKDEICARAGLDRIRPGLDRVASRLR